jgi:hypothetical protein
MLSPSRVLQALWKYAYHYALYHCVLVHRSNYFFYLPQLYWSYTGSSHVYGLCNHGSADPFVLVRCWYPSSRTFCY